MDRRPIDTAVLARARLHRWLFGVSRGRMLATWGGLPVLLLTTTGRHSGIPRRVILTAPLVFPDAIVVVASNGGATAPPAWYRNLEADPRVQVLFGRCRRPMRARTAAAAERATLWPRIVARSPAYGRYQQRAGRDLPVVLLEPA